MNKISLGIQLARRFGVRWLLFRLSYAARMKTGFMRRQFPAYQWSDRPLSKWIRREVPKQAEDYVAWRKKHGGYFFFDGLPKFTSPDAVRKAESILAGRLDYFERTTFEVGFPPNWHQNPVTGQCAQSDKHWSEISDFAAGDIKFIWEASRFGFVFTLVRAYAATFNEKYAVAFWDLLEDWMAHNSPQLGPNWKCGQEATFRVMAFCFGLYGFSAAQATTPQRIAVLSSVIAAHADRIESNINYARSQKNNHGLSEGVGLWTVGLLFPEFERSSQWVSKGRQVITEELRRQVYSDGAYVQHSTNYQRLMLHDCIWAIRLGERNGIRLPVEVYDRVRLSLGFLYQLVDRESGHVPNTGANDGALILPLNDCDYRDFRPVLQAANMVGFGVRLFSVGNWDEDLVWLFGDSSLAEPLVEIAQPDLKAEQGGYYTLRGGLSWALVRCGTYRDRPSHADQLHVDLWWKGINIAPDAGTYLYNGPTPWDNRLSATAVHNTVNVDEQDQMTRVGRFMWLDWAQGTVTQQHHVQHLAYWEGTQDGYQNLKSGVTHHRGILRIGDETWLILDRLRSSEIHDYILHWLLSDHSYRLGGDQITLETPSGDYCVQWGSTESSKFSLDRGTGNQVHGWQSLYYGEKNPALSLQLRSNTKSILFWTLFGPPQISFEILHDRLRVNGRDWCVDAKLGLLIESVSLTGSMEDSLP